MLQGGICDLVAQRGAPSRVSVSDVLFGISTILTSRNCIILGRHGHHHIICAQCLFVCNAQNWCRSPWKVTPSKYCHPIQILQNRTPLWSAMTRYAKGTVITRKFTAAHARCISATFKHIYCNFYFSILQKGGAHGRLMQTQYVSQTTWIPRQLSMFSSPVFSHVKSLRLITIRPGGHCSSHCYVCFADDMAIPVAFHQLTQLVASGWTLPMQGHNLRLQE